ncbi:MAG TPA: M3 family oligoendopeptidase [Acidimicrobiales bacterium]|nr:M3 family oligoendopeptidase [Acidimicrobiales bacterium]
MTTTAERPELTWDLTPFFPGLDSPELAAAMEAGEAGVARLAALYDERDVRRTATPDLDAVDEVLAATNELLDQIRLVNGYLYGFVTTEAANDRAQALLAELRAMSSALGPLRKRLDAWLASFDTGELLAANTNAADHAHVVRRAVIAAAHQLSDPEEELAAELNLTGGSAWNQLHGDVSARLTATVDGEVLPITAVRNLAFDGDAGRRRRAYDAELEAWDSVAVTLAACLNGVKGQASTLNRRRGWSDDLAPVLFGNGVAPEVLAAMQRACVDALPAFRRYLRSKARLLGHPEGKGLPWWDLFAPVGDPAASETTWDDATAAVADAFGSYDVPLRKLAERAIAERWVDVEPRTGKRGGAFCMPVQGDVSRVLLNWSGTVDGVVTLAHELGHAYHNTQLAHRTALQRQTPMALAETASIFCETVLLQSLLAAAEPARRLILLETDLQGACQVVVDIHSRFLFEQRVFEQRAKRPLSVAELRNLMTGAQREAYGDGLGDDLHHDMWAVKPHYYSSAFYNWPYTYGLLFGIGLYARYREDPERFRAGYDDLLAATGLADAAELGARFGIDVADEAFWASSLQVIVERIDEFESLSRA